MEIREVFGIGFGLIVLAGVSMAIINGGKTAQVAQAFSDGFATDIKAATMQGSSGGQ